jgi:hypothetical protein
MPIGTEEYHEKNSEKPVSKSRFERITTEYKSGLFDA